MSTTLAPLAVQSQSQTQSQSQEQVHLVEHTNKALLDELLDLRSRIVSLMSHDDVRGTATFYHLESSITGINMKLGSLLLPAPVV